MTFISVILSSLSFWFGKTDIIDDIGESLMINFATYPEGIFKGIIKVILFTIIPVGIVNYIPIKVLTEFDIKLFLIVLMTTIFIVGLGFIVFYRGLKKYSSGNLMIART